jgi:hypothetical protein
MDLEAFTNPAFELYEFCIFIKNHPVPQDSSNHYDVLTHIFGAKKNSSEFFYVLSALRRRFDNCRMIVESEEAIYGPARKSAISAINHLSLVLNTERSREPWMTLRDQVFCEPHLTALLFLSSILSDRHRLKRITDDDLENILKEVKSFIIEIRENKIGLSLLLTKAIEDSFQDLLLVLERFRFFGHAGIRDKILVADATLRATAAQMAKAESSPAARNQVTRAWTILSTVISLFILPHEASEAIGTYREWGEWVLEHTKSTAPRERLALPAPPPSSPSASEDVTKP